jgi:murein DD-endopeptidase MepM/ murein hydrolase activator NlpD
MNKRWIRQIVGMIGIMSVLLQFGCTRSASIAEPWRLAPDQSSQTTQVPGLPAATPTVSGFQRRTPGAPVLTPTPDAPHAIPTARADPQQYVVQAQDTLGQIASRYGVSLDTLVKANNIVDINRLEVGQTLVIPTPDPLAPGPGFKVIPDSELVYGPGSADFDLAGFIHQKNGYLNVYQEDIDDRHYDGAGVVLRVAQEYSVNPRLLLAVLEYRSGWVTQANPAQETLNYPMRYFDNNRAGLYRQMAWAANNLNRGYYLWRVNAVTNWVLFDGSVVPPDPTINAGTAGVQQFFALLMGLQDWQQAVSESGLFATYQQLFGYPFDYAFEPMIPADLQQPAMQLPFEPGTTWSFTGGPHAGWADGSAWAALDFAPPGEALGCIPSDAWEVAVADGIIIRADMGAVVEDLDGDGREQTGWTVLYMHVATQDRIQPGTQVHAGDHIGHPSCEGGVSTGTHLHLARRYNGEWISADGSIPFILDNWISSGDKGVEYNGFLTKDGVTIEAWEGRRSENAISR